MSTSKIIGQASKLMGEPVHEVIAVNRRPGWVFILVLPLVAAVAVSAPIWICAVAGAVVGVLMVAVTDTRFLAFAASSCGVLIGNRWLPNRLKKVDRVLSRADVRLFDSPGFSRTVYVADEEYSTSKVLAERLGSELARSAT